MVIRVPGVRLRKPLNDHLRLRTVILGCCEHRRSERQNPLTEAFKLLRKEFLHRTKHEY